MKSINIRVSVSMYNLLKKEKNKLMQKERSKIKSKRKPITLISASNSIAMRMQYGNK